MKISAHVLNSHENHQVLLKSDGNAHSISIQPKSSGFGSSTNGGELLFLALATCYCNDIYREAARSEIKIREVAVEVEGNFYEEGKPAGNVTYRAKVIGEASEEALKELVKHTDKVAEIQNTLRVETPVTLSNIEVVSV
ncbi:hypothetical protein D1AOALGA4SA_13092 [Olavius algarvensis Delta 1 endosymbiont]|nr:hypothetical protein D1AOALGA4SA_13092 [Olavius algarvensis Delta 1 endosymbiont]